MCLCVYVCVCVCCQAVTGAVNEAVGDALENVSGALTGATRAFDDTLATGSRAAADAISGVTDAVGSVTDTISATAGAAVSSVSSYAQVCVCVCVHVYACWYLYLRQQPCKHCDSVCLYGVCVWLSTYLCAYVCVCVCVCVVQAVNQSLEGVKSEVWGAIPPPAQEALAQVRAGVRPTQPQLAARELCGHMALHEESGRQRAMCSAWPQGRSACSQRAMCQSGVPKEPRTQAC